MRSGDTVHRRRLAEGTLALVLLAGAFWAGLQLEPRVSPGRPAALAEPTAVTLTVRDATGARLPLAPDGEPAVVMINSGSCAYCARSLADVAALSDGQPVPRLRILTLDGVQVGERMAARAGVNGAWHAEPDGPSAEAMLALNVPGTPVFLLLDADGRVRRSMPGYPGREGMRPWVAVMLGDVDTLVAADDAPLSRTPAFAP